MYLWNDAINTKLHLSVLLQSPGTQRHGNIRYIYLVLYRVLLVKQLNHPPYILFYQKYVRRGCVFSPIILVLTKGSKPAAQN